MPAELVGVSGPDAAGELVGNIPARLRKARASAADRGFLPSRDVGEEPPTGGLTRGDEVASNERRGEELGGVVPAETACEQQTIVTQASYTGTT